MGVHDDRGAVLRERGELGRGEVPALRMVGGMSAQRGAVKIKKRNGGVLQHHICPLDCSR